MLTVPKGHSGDFRKSTEVGEIAVTFTRDPYSDQIRYVQEKGVEVRRFPRATQAFTASSCKDVCPLMDGTWDGSWKPTWAPTVGAVRKTPAD